MNFWKWLTRRQEEEEAWEQEWDNLSTQPEELDLTDSKERHRYLEECLQQMADASKEIEHLSGEYNQVTSYLTDMEELEQLPDAEYEKLQEICAQIENLAVARTSYNERTSRMTDEEYKSMLRRADEVEEGILKIDQAEEYQDRIRQDLKRLDGEKSAYCYRKNELLNERVNIKGMSGIILGAVGFCFVILLILQFAFSFDTRLGYLLAGGLAAVVITILYFRYADTDRELTKVEHAMNRLVRLHNTVKIRYVNNTSLLDYLYAKYAVENGSMLKARWEKYRQEKEERKRYRKTQIELDEAEEELLGMLAQYKLKQPKRWLNQTAAILDHREMVEIRHDLIVRRQALRKRMDYNRDIAKDAKEEIMELARCYPQYAPEIQNMVERYEKMY